MRLAELPTSLRCFIIGHGVVVALHLVRTLPASREPWLLVAALLVCAAVTSLWPFDFDRRQGRMAIAFGVAGIALMLHGPFAAVLCAALGSWVGVLRTRGERGPEPFRARWPHAAALALSSGVSAAGASLVFRCAGDRLPDLEAGVVAGLTAWWAAYFFLHTAGAALLEAWEARRRWWPTWKEAYPASAPAFLVASFSAFGVEKALTASPMALLFLPPLWIIHRSYSSSVERAREHARQVAELVHLNEAIIASLATAIDAKDRYNSSHVNRVRHYSVGLARAAGLKGPELEAVAVAALVHDIGKLGIPDHILGKPGKLTPEEFRRIQSHVTIGADILAAIPFPFPVVDVVLSHHERWDGKGYPRGLRGEEIPMGGRILALIDAFDAMTSNRPYRRALGHEEALAQMRLEAGRHFDPKLFRVFEQVLPRCLEEIAREEAQQLRSALSTSGQGEGGHAFCRISQAAAEMAAVSDVAHSVARDETRPEVAATVVNRILTLVPGEMAVLYLQRPGDSLLRVAAAEGDGSDLAVEHTVPCGAGVIGRVAEEHRPQVNIPLARDASRWLDLNQHPGLEAVTAVPLVRGETLLGVLAVYTAGYAPLSEHHLGVLSIVAEHAACALENLRRMEEHREQARTDPLTGLVNGRGLMRHLDRLLASHADGQAEFSLIMLDLDGFKAVNDRLGHLRGDDLLREIGRRVTEVSRAGDVACRYAGDEFVLLLPRTNRGQAEEVTGRLRRALEHRLVGGVQVGVSLGVATFPEDGRDLRRLIAAADGRMYQDKSRRREPGPPKAEELVA